MVRLLWKTPRLTIRSIDGIVVVSVKGDDAFWIDEDLEIKEWHEFIRREAIALGLIRPPVGADAKPAVLAEMVLDV